ncbi:MAG: outer membrane lipoprotein-sorting protein [SAR324 cluster bacterium]|nr:outer membrane lipoprotein-sorting protein [SAR324 cluster bacterium]
MKLWTTLTLILCLIFPLAGYSQTTPGEWLKTIDESMNPVSYESYRKLINIEPDGRRKEFVLFALKQGADKVALLFLSPASEKGRSSLRVGDNMWLYIPNVAKPIRITSLQSVTGGVFNNADILSVDYQAEYDALDMQTLTEANEGGSKLLQLNLKAKTSSAAYDRLEMVIDPDLKYPLIIRAVSATGMLLKTLYFKDVKDFGGGIRRPAVIETDSPLYKGYKSAIVFASLKAREVPQEVFTTDYMNKIETLR